MKKGKTHIPGISARFIELISLLGFRKVSDFAEKVGANPGIIYHIESGRRMLSMNLLVRTVELAKNNLNKRINIYWLLFGDDEGPPFLPDEIPPRTDTEINILISVLAEEVKELGKMSIKIKSDLEKEVTQLQEQINRSS